MRALGIKIVVAAGALAGATALGAALAADPGSRDDPLITVSYARSLSAFQLRKLPVGDTLQLGPGAELVVVSPEDKPVNAAGFNPAKSVLINLSSGERVVVTALQADQHYVNAGPGELSLRLDAPATVLTRGAAQ